MGTLRFSVEPHDDCGAVICISAAHTIPEPLILSLVKLKIELRKSFGELAEEFPEEAKMLETLDVLLQGFDGRWYFLGIKHDPSMGRVLKIALC